MNIIVTSAVTIVMTLLRGLISALPQITQGALQLLLALVNGIIANLPQLVSAALQMVVTLASGIGDALPKLIPAIVDAVILIVNTLINNMDKVLEAAMKIIEGLALGLINSLPKLIPVIVDAVILIVNTLINNIDTLISDLIVSEGTNIAPWVQSDEELYTTNFIADSTGLTIGSNTTDMKAHISTSAFEIYRGDDLRINVAPDGTRLQKTIIEDDLTVGSVKQIVRAGVGVDFVVI